MKSKTNEPWSRADLFFLEDALRHGMSAEKIAGFLRRTTDEVRAKASELDLRWRRQASSEGV